MFFDSFFVIFVKTILAERGRARELTLCTYIMNINVMSVPLVTRLLVTIMWLDLC